MLTMAVGQGDDVDPLDAIATAIEQCRASLGGLTPQAGILFSAFDSFDPSILAAVAAAFPTATVMGTTSAAEISSINGYQEDSITLAHVRVGQRGHHGRAWAPASASTSTRRAARPQARRWPRPSASRRSASC